MTDDESRSDEVALLRDYVRQGSVMQIATTSADGRPWMAHCWYAAADDLSLVFMSRIGRRHSQDILVNARVSCGILAISLEGLGQTVRGVVLEGTASVVDMADLEAAYGVYSSRWPQVLRMVPMEVLADASGENRLWRIDPTAYVLFDEENFPAQPRRELSTW